MLTDIRDAVRSLVRAPAFLASAVITLALGIGITTSSFSVLNALMFRPIPYPEPRQLVRIACRNPRNSTLWFSPADFLDLRRQADAFSDITIAGNGNAASLAVPGEPAEEVHAEKTDARYFNMLETPPLLGRFITVDDEHVGADRVIVLSYTYWIRRFGGNPAVVGRILRLDGRSVTVVGVMPADFEDPLLWGRTDCWRPQVMDNGTGNVRNISWLPVYGRLRSGVSLATAQAQLNVVAAHLSRDYPKTDAGVRLQASLVDENRKSDQGANWLLLGLSASVLLIACANLASLQLARAFEREREHAIRIALGASKLQMVRHLVSESILLVAISGPLGLAVAFWANRIISRSIPITYDDFISLPIDWNVFLFALGAVLVSGLAIGLAPAFMALRSDVAGALKLGSAGASGDRSRRRSREILLAAEIALSMVLLTAAVFFVHGFRELAGRDLGWRPDHVLLGGVEMPWTRYPTDESCRPFIEKLEAAIIAMPGAQYAALSSDDPIFGGFPRQAVKDGAEPANSEGKFFARDDKVTPGYLSAAGLNLVAGRWIAQSDRKGSPAVAVVNESLGRTQWPGESPIGKRIQILDGDHYSQFEVVGVVGDTKPPLNYASYVPQSEIYRPMAQFIGHGARLEIRSKVDPEALSRTLQTTISQLDPDMAVFRLRPASADMNLLGKNLVMINYGISFYAAFGLLLAGIGIYSLIARVIHQRTREIGIRMALGAAGSQVVRLIVWRGFGLALIGAAFGVAGGIAAARVCSKMVTGYPELSWAWFAISVMGLLGLALVSCYVPARRAARVDPMVALRTE
jgi:putative ABC transport system permease protein